MENNIFNSFLHFLSIFRKNRFADGIVCPYCHSKNIIKNGKYKEKQRYICKTCRKNFNDFTCSPLSMIHFAEKWPLFMKETINGMSLRRAAKVLGVSYVTLFYWRHKLLIALRQASFGSLGNLIESDDTILAYSEKGKKSIVERDPKKRGERCIFSSEKKVIVLMVSDHSKNLIVKATLLNKFNCQYINSAIGDLVNKETVFCSNLKAQYCSFARIKKLKHYRLLNLDKRFNYNLETARNHIKNLKEWLRIFKGVASKYLNSYLALFKFLAWINFDGGILGLSKLLDIICKQYVYKSNTAVTDQDLVAA